MLNPKKVGVAVKCAVCGYTKKPVGRAEPLGTHYCVARLPTDVYGCDFYWSDPKPGSLWPGESEADFGYPVGGNGVEIRS